MSTQISKLNAAINLNLARINDRIKRNIDLPEIEAIDAFVLGSLVAQYNIECDRAINEDWCPVHVYDSRVSSQNSHMRGFGVYVAPRKL